VLFAVGTKRLGEVLHRLHHNYFGRSPSCDKFHSDLKGDLPQHQTAVQDQVCFDELSETAKAFASVSLTEG